MQTQRTGANNGAFVATIPLAEDTDVIAGVHSGLVQLENAETDGQPLPKAGVLRDTKGREVGTFALGIPMPWLAESVTAAAAAVRACEDALMFAGLAAVEGVTDDQRAVLVDSIQARRREALMLTGGDLSRVTVSSAFFDELVDAAEQGMRVPGTPDFIHWEPTA